MVQVSLHTILPLEGSHFYARTLTFYIFPAASDYDNTAWAFMGPIYLTVALAPMVGFVLLFVGSLMQSNEHQCFRTTCAALVLSIISMMAPSQIDYHAAIFPFSGFFILVFCYASLWNWAKCHQLMDRTLQGSHCCRLASYLFFFMTALHCCMLLGNPFSGLFHHGRTEVNPGSWPYLNALGARIAIYLTLGFGCSFMSDYFLCHALRNEAKMKHNS